MCLVLGKGLVVFGSIWWCMVVLTYLQEANGRTASERNENIKICDPCSVCPGEKG